MYLQNREIVTLSVETALRSGSLAILRDEKVCARWQGAETGAQAASELLVAIERLLAQTNFEIENIDLLAGATGPGSFTGLRVGLATLKGLAAALDKPICGVPTLAAMAFGRSNQKIKITILPAGRSEVFKQMWRLNDKEELVVADKLETNQLAHILANADSTQFLEWVVTKENYQIVADFIADQKKTKWTVAPAPPNLAANVAQIAIARYKKHQIKSVEEETAIIYGRQAVVGQKTFS